MKVLAQVKNNGIEIPRESMKDFNENDIVEIQIAKIYVGKSVNQEVSEKGFLVFQ